MKSLPMLAALACLVAAPMARGQQAPSYSGDLSRLGDAEVDRRLAFLEERLEAGRRHGQIWQYGFTGVFAAGVVVGTVNAALRHEADDRVADIVTAAKAAFGTASMLLEPHPARLGAAPLKSVAGDSRPARLDRLAAAERQLAALVERGEERFSWQRHAAVVAVNAVGGIVVGILGRNQDAIVDSAVGLVIGEIRLWTMPWRSEGDLRDYRASFGTGGDPAVSWHLAPLGVAGAHGLAVHLRF